ncbi:DUF523 and DUF1722 domain-containing protein [Anaeromyxobacter sp. Fw109-5]|uniref:YbgA family protein n=1 Tax=Anaeromyxobacter sp. (strain Fw109-5) TaxID=404589 RepID=UPI000158A7A2|nr:DUF523 and DUF1722 domain-containing protein [Anaeromyxobacter sp. Fw109-5]ABS27205.1 protein of unknown function DUF523 [Anaeromyxobacter sp. Fw109-5]
MAKARLRLGVSSCLLGRNVRYDGQHKRDPFLVEVLGDFVEWVPVCPELEVGMGVPREPIRLVGPSRSPRLVAERSGADHTEAMRRYAEARVAELEGLELSGYVTKKDSPSCGMARVRVYPQKGGPPRRDGVGAFARVLLEAMPLLPVEEEGRLADPALRESFIERIFAYARWKAAVAAGMRRGDLVAFHAAHKLALLAHSPSAYRRLGALVASMKKGSIAPVVDAYGRGFMEALRVPATRGRHTNVLQHMLGYFRDALPRDDRKELEEVVRDYGRGLVPLVVPQTLFRHHVRREGVAYLAAQTYLDPDPKELMLRNRV